MQIIAGLGNPKREYGNTRHNIGFEVIDLLAKRYGIRVLDQKHRALTGKGMMEGHRVLLVKPLTFMNLSGESIREIIDYYQADPAQSLTVICDDINLDAGRLRVRKKGSAGGHNGLKNIISCLGTEEFKRIRIGVGGKPEGWDLADYVLSHYTPRERALMNKSAEMAAQAAAVLIAEGPDAAMNCFNHRQAEE